jgi:hypothetical protein
MSKSTSSSMEGPAGSTSDTWSTQNAFSDPFHSPFDEDHDDEWRDDEGPSNSTETPTAPSRLTQWPVVSKEDIVPTSKSIQKSTRKPTKRYSVYKPTREKSRQRQKKQNAAAGIKVITNFSRHHGPPPVVQQPNIATEAPRNVLQPGCFVDLAALQTLENQAPSNNGGFWKSIKGMMPSRSDLPNGQEVINANESRNLDAGDAPTTEPALGRIGSRRGQRLMPPPLRLEADLSPNDRPIVIGISVPSARLTHHVTSPQTAISETGTVIQSAGTMSPEGIPETPAIIITPNQTPSTWFRSQQDSVMSKQRPWATSSVYSRTTTYSQKDLSSSGAPPVPRMPPPPLALDKQKRKSRKSVRYSSSTIFSDDGDITSARKSRAVSSYTVFEEDESPILARKARAVSISDGNMAIKHTSITTVGDQRTSKGWWNYLTSPFLTRSNTLASPKSSTQEHPALPSLATAAVKAQEGRYPREWEKSVFSPVTPETSTTIASDVWWDKRNTTADITSPEEESGTLPFMLAAGEATLENSGIQSAVPESTANEDSLKRRPAIRDKFSAQNTSDVVASSMRAEPVPRLPTSVTGNPYPQPSVQDLNPSSVLPAPQPGNNSTQGIVPNNAGVMPSFRDDARDSPQPPPYSPPRINYPRYHAVFPPGHQNHLPEPPSPGPLSPGLQQAMSSRGGIALADVPLTPTPRRPINLNSGYPVLPARQPELFFAPPPGSEQKSKKARKAEAKRRRYEKEEVVAHKVGGLWRGRGCVPKRGCYGRSGAEGRKRRRCWFGLIAGFLTMIILIVVLATTLHRSSATVVEPTQWLNLTGFPPIYTGISTVAVPDNPVANTGCVFPATVWSCSLPKELQQSVAPNQPDQPNFRLQIQWDNSSSANATFANVTGNPNLITRTLGGNAVSARQFIRSLMHKARQSMSFTPSPTAPSWAEQYFLGNTTDGIVSDNKAGEPTPFYVSFLSTTASISAKLLRRDNSTDLFPDVVSILNSEFPPDVNADGTSAPANLLPYPVQQPLRLYDRGLDSEHYGFYNYFNRSIFVKSLVPLNESNSGNGEVPDDQNGGSTESEASWRCTWSETRFLVQMWTRKGSTASLLNSATSAVSSPMSTSSANYTANDFTRPGSFPYPITITTDRHGGDTLKKKLYCYEIDSREQPITSSAKLWEEQRDFGGVAINPGPGLFTTSSNNTDASLGGYDGGTGGCSCQWTNWQLSG